MSIPTTNPLWEIEVNLKDGCSLLHPSWIIRTSNILEYAQCNYCNFNGRYYFITDMIILRNELIEITATVDVLATYQQYVLSYTGFIERAASAYDAYVVDNLLSPSSVTLPSRTFTSRQLNNWSGSGTFVVRVISGIGGTSSTGIKTYALTSTDLNALVNSMFSQGRYDFLTDSSIKSFFNPFQYFVDCKWFPFNSSAFGAGDEEIGLGWWSTGVRGVLVNNTTIYDNVDVTVPSGVYNDFRKYDNRWSVLRILIPGAGMYYLNPSEIGDAAKVEFDIDIATGEGIVKIHPSNSQVSVIAVYSGKFCSTISIGQLETNTAGLISSGMSVVGALTAGNLLGAAGNMVQVAENFLQPTPSLNGTSGNMGALLNTSHIVLTLTQKDSKDFPAITCGRPVMGVKPISMFTGFIKCGNASMLIPGTSEELKMLNNFMNGGFYNE